MPDDEHDHNVGPAGRRWASGTRYVEMTHRRAGERRAFLPHPRVQSGSRVKAALGFSYSLLVILTIITIDHCTCGVSRSCRKAAIV